MSLMVSDNSLFLKNPDTGEYLPVSIFNSGADKSMEKIAEFAEATKSEAEAVMTTKKTEISEGFREQLESQVDGVISEAKVSAEAAIEAKKNEVLGEIPDSYTELQGGVNQVKDDISYLKEVYFKKVINAGNHWLNINPKVGQKYKVTNNTTMRISLGLYDSSKTLITHLGAVDTNNTSIFKIKNDAYYLLVYVPVDGDVIIEEVTRKVPVIETKIDELHRSKFNNKDIIRYIEPYNLIDIGDIYENSDFVNGNSNSNTGEIISGTRTIAVVPVMPSGSYYFTKLSNAYYNIVLYDANKNFISTMYSYHGNSGEWNREWSVPDNCYYVAFVIDNSYKETAFFGTKSNYDKLALNEYKYHLNSSIDVDEKVKSCLNHRLIIEKSEMVNGEKLELDVSNIKQNNIFTFSGKLNGAFNSLYLAHGKESTYSGMFVKVDNTKLYFYRYHSSPILVKSVEHGLIISDFINVSVNILQNQTAKVIITTTGGKFESENRWQGSKGEISAELENCSMSNCILTYYCSDYDKKLWAFGDSWFYDYDNARWPELVINDGYIGAMFDGYGGNTSLNAYSSLQKCLQFGKPDTILWCLGMNNPDSSSKVNSEWNSVFNQLKNLCTELNINLILCTIPTSSTNNHNFKNEIIRQSGYRYVDISFALGAEESTDWYSGLQASDHIHPTPQGSNVIASRMIAEVPELLG